MDSSRSLALIDQLVEDYNQIQDKLLREEPSTTQSISRHLTKVLVLSCASYYEQELKRAYTTYAETHARIFNEQPHRFTVNDKDDSIYKWFYFGRIEDPSDQKDLPEPLNFLKPLSRFGIEFSAIVISEVLSDEAKQLSVRAFQEIFVMRNLIAHQTNLEFDSIRGKSFNEIKSLHTEAKKFVDYLSAKF